MDENLRGALSVIMVLGGLALIVSATFLHYVALPDEQDRKHRTIRAALALSGLVLFVAGTAYWP